MADRAARLSGEWGGRAGIAGLTITEPCAVTGLPAEVVHDPVRGLPGPRQERVTAAVAAARELGHKQRDRFADALLDDGHQAGDGPWFAFPTQIDELGRSSGTRSLVGVVHIDFDGLGTRMASWLSSLPDEVDLGVIRRAEEAIDAFVTGLARHIVATLRAAVDSTGPALTGHPARLGFPLPYVDTPGSARQGTIMLPVRPVLVGGDDLTVLCDGRLAWSVAAAAFRYLAAPDNPPATLRELGVVADGERLTACAGVAVISSGYPLSAAQELANGLCGRAKHEARSRVQGNRPRECHVSWHRGDHAADTVGADGARVYSESELRDLLHDFLDPAVPTSLRGEHPPPKAGEGTVPWSGRRTWLRSRLGPEIERGSADPYRTAKKLLEETRHIHGPIALPAKRGRWAELVTDAIDLLDRHLDISPTPASEREQP